MENSLKIKIKKTYGIEILKTPQNMCFSKDTKILSIYAPNGTMKSSFAKALVENNENVNVKINNENISYKNIKQISQPNLSNDLMDSLNKVLKSEKMEAAELKYKNILNNLTKGDLSVIKHILNDKVFQDLFSTHYNKKDEKEFLIFKDLLSNNKKNKDLGDFDFLNDNFKKEVKKIKDSKTFSLYEKKIGMYNSKQYSYIKKIITDAPEENLEFESFVEEIIIVNKLYKYTEIINNFKLENESFVPDIYNLINVNKEIENLKYEVEQKQDKIKEDIENFNNIFTLNYLIKYQNRKIEIQKKIEKNHSIDNCSCPKTNLDYEKIMSKGEKKCLDLLKLFLSLNNDLENIKLIVIDDVFDSFDNENILSFMKYFINFKKENENIYLIFLTHDFKILHLIKTMLKSKTFISKIDGKSCRNNISIKEFKEKDKKIGDLKTIVNKNKYTNKDINLIIKALPYYRENMSLFKGTNSNDFFEEKFTNLTNYLHLKESTKNLEVKDLLLELKSILNLKKSLEKDNNIEGLNKKYLDSLFDIIKEDLKETKDEDNVIIYIIGLRLLQDLFYMNLIQKSKKVIKLEKLEDSQSRILKNFCDKNNLIDLSNKDHEKITNEVSLLINDFIHLNDFKHNISLEISNKIYLDLLKSFNHIFEDNEINVEEIKKITDNFYKNNVE